MSVRPAMRSPPHRDGWRRCGVARERTGTTRPLTKRLARVKLALAYRLHGVPAQEATNEMECSGVDGPDSDGCAGGPQRQGGRHFFHQCNHDADVLSGEWLDKHLE